MKPNNKILTRQRSLNIFRLLTSIILITALLVIIDIRAMFDGLMKANLYLVLAAIILANVTTILYAWRWKYVLKSGNVSLRLFQSLRLYYIGSYASSFLPGSWGGDLVRPMYLFRKNPGRRSFLYASVFFERLCGLFVVIFLASIGSIWVVVNYRKLFFMGIPAVFMIGLILIFSVIQWAGKPKGTISGPLKKYQAWIADFCGSISLFTRNYRLLATVLGISTLAQIVWILVYWLLLLALGVKANIILVLFATSTSILMGALPISLAGLGVREGSIVYLLGQFGVSPEKASAAALLGLIPYLVFALNGGIMAAYSTRFDGGLKKRGRSYR